MKCGVLFEPEHIVALSGGKDSVAMALLLKEREPRPYTYVCTPTGNELPAMDEHWERLSTMLDAPIIRPPGKSLEELIQIQCALPNFQQRWCTRMIKLKPFEDFIKTRRPCTVYVGIRADESGDREGVDYDALDLVTRRFVLDEWGYTLPKVLSYLEARGVTIPERTDCAWCFFQTLYEWYLLWLNHSEMWARGELYEFATGHTFRSNQRDSQPASMRGLRTKFESGYIPKDKRKKRTQMCSVCAR